MSPGTKLGPLPAWAWGLVILGGVGIGLYLRKRGPSTATTPTPSGFGGVPSTVSGAGTDSGASSAAGMDPLLAQLFADQSSALVAESGYFAGLAGQGMDAVISAGQSLLTVGADLASKTTTTTNITYNVPSSPAGASPTGTTAESPGTTTTLPTGGSPYPTWTPGPTPGTFLAPHVGTAGVVQQVGGVPALVDVTGHVVNAKGARVGGAVMDM